jgi:predicted nucleic acid-binding protein
MKIECFLDTNVLIYAAMGRLDEPRKFEVASALVENKDFGLSGQVLAEFCVNATQPRRGRTPLTENELDLWVALLSDYPVQAVDTGIVQLGVAHSRRFRISYWDAALIAAAERLDAPVLYTEDLNHDQLYGSVRVVNPFRPN